MKQSCQCQALVVATAAQSSAAVVVHMPCQQLAVAETAQSSAGVLSVSHASLLMRLLDKLLLWLCMSLASPRHKIYSWKSEPFGLWPKTATARGASPFKVLQLFQLLLHVGGQLQVGEDALQEGGRTTKFPPPCHA